MDKNPKHHKLIIVTAFSALLLSIFSAVASAQDRAYHPTLGPGFDHYPHFGKSYYYGDLEKLQHMQAERSRLYGKHKGKVWGTLLGAAAGMIVAGDGDDVKGAVIGGIAGGMTGYLLVDQVDDHSSILLLKAQPSRSFSMERANLLPQAKVDQWVLEYQKKKKQD
ncbi:glycine zipper domain-containing protein [Temperatibacter marinus]|uniref:Glycine zipper domain-containing protein n=1 Tax=Temperatibacter marinus TaxID=1456591 RepID=A0AA52EIG1_9PROT|nr:glycine zipper domain-containing protein [Temperatibacter marinus]WND03109.1 glycine zipper domain-containing protein [Temperatibacter marinus]